MANDDWSPAGITAMKAKNEEALQKDPLVEQQEMKARQEAQKEQNRIAAARERRLMAMETKAKRDVPDALIDQRLAEAAGALESHQSMLPAQRDRARVEERLRFAKEFVNSKHPGQGDLTREWNEHVDGLGKSPREKIRYNGEAQGKQFTEKELNDKEARAYAHAGPSDGVHGPSEKDIERLIDIAKRNGNWPPPELHTGPGSRPGPREHSFQHFSRLCQTPPRLVHEGHHIDENAGRTGRVAIQGKIEGRSSRSSEREDGSRAGQNEHLLAAKSSIGIVQQVGLQRAVSRAPGLLAATETTVGKAEGFAVSPPRIAESGLFSFTRKVARFVGKTAQFLTGGKIAPRGDHITRTSSQARPPVLLHETLNVVRAASQRDFEQGFGASNELNRKMSPVVSQGQGAPHLKNGMQKGRPQSPQAVGVSQSSALDALAHRVTAGTNRPKTISKSERTEFANPDSIPDEHWRVPTNLGEIDRLSAKRLQSGRPQPLRRDSLSSIADDAPPSYEESQRSVGQPITGPVRLLQNRNASTSASPTRSPNDTAILARRSLIEGREREPRSSRSI